MAVNINIVTNANVYLDGEDWMGRVKEVSLPELKATTTDVEALGLIGKIEVPTGMDKLEATFNWVSVDDVVARRASNPFRAVAIQVRGSQETHDSTGKSAEVPVEWHMRGQFKTLQLGTLKKQEIAEGQSTFNCTSVKCVVNGLTVFEYDAFANKMRIDGEDVLAAYRANIGQQ